MMLARVKPKTDTVKHKPSKTHRIPHGLGVRAPDDVDDHAEAALLAAGGDAVEEHDPVLGKVDCLVSGRGPVLLLRPAYGVPAHVAAPLRAKQRGRGDGARRAAGKVLQDGPSTTLVRPATTTDMNQGQAHWLASIAPTLYLWLEITPTVEIVIQVFI